MPGSSAFSFLRTLCSLRWLAIAGQAATILVASAVLGLALPLEPLWIGVGVLIGFNVYASLRCATAATCPTPPPSGTCWWTWRCWPGWWAGAAA